MTCRHTALLDLPDILTSMGLNVLIADDWAQGQCQPVNQFHYCWTNPHTEIGGDHEEHPHAYMVHHSASRRATLPDHDTSKASAWAGLLRADGKLYQSGEGSPSLYLASAGPARISSGYGYWPALSEYAFQGRRAPALAEGRDGDKAGNRYSFNIEGVHAGDGSAMDKGVWEHIVGLGIALEELFGMREITLGHRSWSGRKIDPNISVGLPHDGLESIIDIQEAIANRSRYGMPYEQFKNLVISLFAGRPDKFHGDPAYFYTKTGPQHAFPGYPNGGIYDVPGSIDWVNFWNAFTDAISLES